MTRRLLNLLTVLSLLLCVAVAVLWVRSFGTWDEVAFFVRGPLVRIASADGSCHVQLVFQWPGRPGWQWDRRAPPPAYTPRVILGEAVTHGADVIDWQPPVGALRRNTGSFFVERANGSPLWLVHTYRRVPYAVLAATFLLPTVARQLGGALLRWRQRCRAASGRCARCGYDLRATPDRCPECGHAPAGASA
jgi:hypothetical protein